MGFLLWVPRPAILVLRPRPAVRAVGKGSARADDQVWAKAQPHQPLTTPLKAQKGLWISSFPTSFSATPAVVSVDRGICLCLCNCIWPAILVLRPRPAVRAVGKGSARADDQVWAKAQPHQPLTTPLKAQKGLWISSFPTSFSATPAVVSVDRGICLCLCNCIW
ncbi:hypothetical protein L3X38_008136 [Prunus dulcis]|uniref:Uncharacterized protein n=1 Tax=Prunus dulcis TaxID=3755 RepID=A0AAD4ZW36_PRUDU|nr:hypothetical protein L3X38_008136 [Prunus dulcis]